MVEHPSCGNKKVGSVKNSIRTYPVKKSMVEHPFIISISSLFFNDFANRVHVNYMYILNAMSKIEIKVVGFIGENTNRWTTLFYFKKDLSKFRLNMNNFSLVVVH